MENHSKLGNNGSMGLHGALSLKMSTYMIETDYLAHFITESIFPIKLLKNSLSFGKIKFLIKNTEKTKKMKNWKNLGGLRHVHMTRPWCLACLYIDT